MTSMATLSKPVGYECEFVDQVPEDYLCKLCKHVAREATIASCCTEVLCKACIDAVIQDKKPCPSCESNDISILGPHEKYQPKILALQVCCLMKNRGCEWTGQLQHLDAHLDVTTGDCVYVDVDCPSDCNQKVQKSNVNTHLDEECPNTDASLKISQEQQQTFEQKLHEKDAQIKALEDQQQKKLGEQQEEFHKQLEEKDQQIKTLQEHGPSMNSLRMAVGTPPYDITFTNYQEKKARGGYIDSPPMYTHPGGYKFKLILIPNGWGGGRGTHVSVLVFSLKGGHDDKLKFPVKFTITIELVNQHRDQDHITRDIQCVVLKGDSYIGYNYKFIPHADLEWNPDKQTEYLKNDCLICRLTKIVKQ